MSFKNELSKNEIKKEFNRIIITSFKYHIFNYLILNFDDKVKLIVINYLIYFLINHLAFSFS